MAVQTVSSHIWRGPEPPHRRVLGLAVRALALSERRRDDDRTTSRADVAATAAPCVSSLQPSPLTPPAMDGADPGMATRGPLRAHIPAVDHATVELATCDLTRLELGLHAHLPTASGDGVQHAAQREALSPRWLGSGWTAQQVRSCAPAWRHPASGEGRTSAPHAGARWWWWHRPTSTRTSVSSPPRAAGGAATEVKLTHSLCPRL
jgi:hypothetical protein